MKKKLWDMTPEERSEHYRIIGKRGGLRTKKLHRSHFRTIANKRWALSKKLSPAKAKSV